MTDKIQQFFKVILERMLSIASYIFPFSEVTVYFSSQVCYSSNEVGLKLIYANHLYPLILFYEKYVYLIFAFMVGIFFVCSKNLIPTTKFLSYNIIQSILLNIMIACGGQIYLACPTSFKLSILGLILANSAFLGTIFWIGYSIFIISLGRFPILPIISRAANIHLRR